MPEPTTRLGFDREETWFLSTVCALAGTGLGVAAPSVAGWAADLRWVPFQGPLRLIRSFDPIGEPWTLAALGLLVGLACAAHLVHQSPVLRVSAARLEITRGGATRRIARSDVAGVFRDGRKVVVESHGGRRLFHADVEGGKDTVRDAFVSHGYPWDAAPEQG